MTGQNVLTQIVQWTAWSIAMAALMGWLGRSRLKQRAPAEARILEYPASILVLGSVCIVLFLSFAVLSSRSRDPRDAHLWPAFVGFALLGAPLVAEYFLVRHVVAAEGMEFKPLIKRSGFFRWEDVTRIRYSTSAKWFRIDLRDGRVVRISAMLIGLPEFARAILASVPTSRIDPSAAPVIERTAAGNPPAVWGKE